MKSISFRCGVCQEFTVWYYPAEKVTNEQLNAWRDKKVREHLTCEPVEDDEED